MVRGQYYLGCTGIMTVYDVTRPETLKNLPRWFEKLKKHKKQDLIDVIVGNKSDLRKKIQKSVSTTQGREFVTASVEKFTSKPTSYIETSAKTGENVEQAFQWLAKSLLQDRRECT